MTVRDHEIELFSGGFFDVTQPDPEVIRLEDVASGLSKTCRFTGQCLHFYSVAEHAVLCADRLEELGYDTRLQMAALHHDDHEAFMCDIPRPIKYLIGNYEELAQVVQDAILTAIYMPDLPVSDPIIKDVDNWALMQEAGELLPSHGTDWKNFGHTWDGVFRVEALDPRSAYLRWTRRHSALAKSMPK